MTVLDPPKYGPRYVEALAWAAELHRDQGRKSAPGEPATIPYLAHLLEVSSLVWLGGGDEDQAIAGLLHDAVEDTDAEARHVAGRFGERVADLVVACSEASPSGVRDGSTWLDRKLDYLIALYLGEHADALLVTAADKVSNARAIVDDLLATAATAPRPTSSGAASTPRGTPSPGTTSRSTTPSRRASPVTPCSDG